ncbi:MAG: glutathione S-transferase N-terminal domain-containing protein [Steroidobacteraceae bacterium]
MKLQELACSRRWPAQHPDRLQLYSLATPNGVKVSIMLEETGLPYEVHKINFDTADQKSPEFLALNPNGKIPVLIDPAATQNEPLILSESGAILLYLAQKTGQLLPSGVIGRNQCMQWLMFQVSAIGPMFGQLGFFHRFAGREWPDKRPRDRYATESRRLLGVLDAQLATREWLMGDAYSIADIAVFPMIDNLVKFYGAGELVGIDDFRNVGRACESFLARPAVIRGIRIPA